VDQSDRSDAFDFVELVSRLDCPEKVIAEFSRSIERYGFTALATGELPRPSAKGLRPFFVSTWKPALAEAYVGEGFFHHDPSIETARHAVLPVLWSELEARWRTAARGLGVFQFTAAHGFTEGFVIPIHGPDNYGGAFGRR
jgi:LuxR family quorum sensing-dependent transcriptional regulator